MGVSLEVYRCRIGSFHGHCGLSFSLKGVCTNDGCGLSTVLLAAAILGTLLLIGGVEPNPGPPGSDAKYTCRICGEVFSSPANYCNHVKIHLSYKKVASHLIPCSAQKCGARISTIASFKSHFSLYHGQQVSSQQSAASASSLCSSVLCPIENCSSVMNTRQEYTAHMGSHLREGEKFKCFLTGCPGTELHGVEQMSTHNNRYHKGTLTKTLSSQVIKEVVVCSPAPAVDTQASHDDDDDDYEDAIADHGPSTADCDDDEDLYPLHAIKDEMARFYLRLEAVELLPSSTVQLIAGEITLLSELIHHVLKKNLKKELQNLKIQPNVINHVVLETFRSEPIFNIHHKGRDSQQLGTEHLRMTFFRERFQFVEPKEIYFGEAESGKKKCAQFVSIRESLVVMLKDPKVKSAVLNSFNKSNDIPNIESSETILQDFTDGTVFHSHVNCAEHQGKNCIRLFLFQDGFDPNAFGSGNYKPLGFYYSIANLPSHIRLRLDKIQMAFMVLEQDLKNSTAEELRDFDRLSKSLQPIIDDLIDLKTNGVLIDGNIYPVCLIFLIGDSLGQNLIGRFVTNFSSSAFSCRFCVMSKEDFRENPQVTRALRTPEQYNEYVDLSKRLWLQRRKRALEVAKARGQKVASKCSAPSKKIQMRDAVSRDALAKMTAINFRGVKYRPSPFNRHQLQFHVINHQPPCLAHDLFEGIVKKIVPLILENLAEKNWFDLSTLNHRIRTFKPKGSDAADRPKPLKNFEKLTGNAVENWNFVRFLPLMIGDLIQDPDDPHWQMFILLKQLVEYVCAPSITIGQISHLTTLISEFILLVKIYFESCLIPKLHYLCHYPGLIIMFGPLIRLFTLRFESKHAFFKRVIRSCKNYINVTRTMAKKYMYRFAYDASFESYQDVEYTDLVDINYHGESKEMKKILHSAGQFQEMKKVTVCGTSYTAGSYLLLSDLEGLYIRVGCIKKIVLGRGGGVSLVLAEMKAEKSPLGFYIIQSPLNILSLRPVEDLPDYVSLESYKFQGKDCISLKHSVPFIY